MKTPILVLALVSTVAFAGCGSNSSDKGSATNGNTNDGPVTAQGADNGAFDKDSTAACVNQIMLDDKGASSSFSKVNGIYSLKSVEVYVVNSNNDSYAYISKSTNQFMPQITCKGVETPDTDIDASADVPAEIDLSHKTLGMEMRSVYVSVRRGVFEDVGSNATLNSSKQPVPQIAKGRVQTGDSASTINLNQISPTQIEMKEKLEIQGDTGWQVRYIRAIYSSK